MKIYNDVLRRVMEEGNDRKTRNGMTRALFAIQMRFNMADGFPAVTTKKLAWKAVKSELLWFLAMKGKERASDEDLKQMNSSERTIWTDNAEADYWKPKVQFKGDLGRIYGIQWRNWLRPNGNTVDQVAELIKKLKENPTDRRLIVSAWNPGELDNMALPPCHMLYQCFVADGKLSLHMIQRSCDMFLGVPFNIASYSLLLHMLAQVSDLTPHECILTLQDAHVYHEHFDAVKEQLSRTPFPLPTLKLNPAVKDIDGFSMEGIELENYQSHPAIKAKMAV
ncbi:thymidylate synthase [Candidatus Kaiserbacteria bacterium RIFCSPHIGHO2_01_FULL_55_17]|uniref:Thymidylate synthase n=1 Tax=Candidatus Kaiserbacteria bacterium RIFCSPHIGHO2_01_FULL_55_17 TaxID=1798484 RepID=A0A1F6DAI4_9BACT|nr:MAG: thymidylate synthase [Candidatus Kaiserbacteria bacterium RIFCSPHIGHO2_01_FULL_55_17]